VVDEAFGGRDPETRRRGWIESITIDATPSTVRRLINYERDQARERKRADALLRELGINP
jgi:hypothetical protein